VKHCVVIIDRSVSPAAREQHQKVTESLLILTSSGSLVEYVIESYSPSSDAVRLSDASQSFDAGRTNDDAQVKVAVQAKLQWSLLRSHISPIIPPQPGKSSLQIILNPALKSTKPRLRIT